MQVYHLFYAFGLWCDADTVNDEKCGYIQALYNVQCDSVYSTPKLRVAAHHWSQTKQIRVRYMAMFMCLKIQGNQRQTNMVLFRLSEYSLFVSHKNKGWFSEWINFHLAVI